MEWMLSRLKKVVAVLLSQTDLMLSKGSKCFLAVDGVSFVISCCKLVNQKVMKKKK